LEGEKLICLAITEPYGGSDVSQLKTTAVKTADGRYYVVNGMKKWITTGVHCDFFTTAVRTSDNGMFGLSLLLIEKEMKGVFLRKMKT
jgi:alkylation response protein AidB-like acyl-CoA dehydrogenase